MDAEGRAEFGAEGAVDAAGAGRKIMAARLCRWHRLRPGFGQEGRVGGAAGNSRILHISLRDLNICLSQGSALSSISFSSCFALWEEIQVLFNKLLVLGFCGAVAERRFKVFSTPRPIAGSPSIIPPKSPGRRPLKKSPLCWPPPTARCLKCLAPKACATGE